MKKNLAILVVSLLTTLSVNAENVLATNITSIGNPAFRLINQRANVTRIILSGSLASTIKFYDQSTMTDPYYGTNYVTSAHVSVGGYATNYATEVISETGYTNYMTNTGWFTYTTTNAAATNVLSPVAVYSIPANTVDTEIPVPPLLFTKAVTVQCSTNINVILYWNSGQ